MWDIIKKKVQKKDSPADGVTVQTHQSMAGARRNTAPATTSKGKSSQN